MRFPLYLISILLLLLAPLPAWAGSIIRDTEIESVLNSLTFPIFRAAGLNPEAIHLYLIDDKEVNAFVAGGMNMFLNTGLLLYSDDPLIMVGVVAHETGHIAGGHLARSGEAMEGAGFKTALGYLLGITAAAVGSPEAGAALLAGSSHVMQRQMLKFSRGQEEAADQSGLSFLDKTGQSAAGLLALLEYLNLTQAQQLGTVNPYILTHPLTSERIASIRAHLLNSPFANKKIPAELTARYKVAMAKLAAFLKPANETLKTYPVSRNDMIARYARAIAYYKIPDLLKSLHEIDGLIRDYPANPYFTELKGQILFENGKVEEAVPYYQKSLNLLPDSALLKLQLARAQLAAYEKHDNVFVAKPRLLKKVITNLEQALVKERDNTLAWRQLAIAYGRDGQVGMSSMALAEEALLQGRKEDALRFARMAEKQLPTDAPALLRVKDIMGIAGKKK